MTWHIPLQRPLVSQSDNSLPSHSNEKLERFGDLMSNGNTSLEPSSRNGDFLLQLLRAGNNNNQKVGGKEHVERQEEEQIPWQLHDPAVAAMGPSRPFPARNLVGDIYPDVQSSPSYMPQAFRIGLAPPFHPENAFSLTEPHYHPARENSFPPFFPEAVEFSSQSPVGYTFQSNADHFTFPPHGEPSYPQTVEGFMPSSVRHSLPSVDQAFVFQTHPTLPFLSRSGQMDDTNKPSSGKQRFQDWKGVVDQANLETKEGFAFTGPQVAAHQQQHVLLSHQQFYGNGAELLQLLQGNADKIHDLTSGKEPAAGLLGGIPDAGNQFQRSSQKGSVLTVHGPIGPPKRSCHSPPKSPKDILGKLWKVTPSTQSSQDFCQEGSLRSSFHEDDGRAVLEVPTNEATCISEGKSIQEKNLETLSSSGLVNSGNVFFCQGDADVSTIATSKGSASKIPSESIEPYRARSSLNGWESWNSVNGASQFPEQAYDLHQHNRKSSANRGQFEKANDCISMKLNCSQGLRIMEPIETARKGSEIELLCESEREDNSRRGGRQRIQSRGESKKSSSKGIAGQWVAVNERHKGREVEVSEEKHDSRTSKLMNGVISKADEAKRRKRLQQEWRLKQPQLEGSLQQKLLTDLVEDDRDSRLEAKGSVNTKCENQSGSIPFVFQLEHPGLPAGCQQDSVTGPALQEGRRQLHGIVARYEQDEMDNGGLEAEDCEKREELLGKEEQEELIKEFADYLELEDDQEVRQYSQNSNGLPNHQAIKDPEVSASGNRSREPRRLPKKGMQHRVEMENFTIQLFELYISLIPSEEEEMRRSKVLSQLDGVVYKTWPGAKLFLYGSCANAFGVRNSDIDVCLTVEDRKMNKAELVVRMAAILEGDNMQNVQALTHARVPVVKFTDPVTGISCDICVNNMLAVVNSKLLHDYSKIDVRLRQLAFMVKHWAKRRQVNETYRGTLSSYAYVMMCIHFLQQRNPPILPCLQEMQPTYRVKVGKIECAYYDQVDTLRHFGFQNKETLGELVASFFEYWAFHHDYNHLVISVRTGGFLSKDEKDWTRRIGNDRHLICIEDPFEVSHDLGRVVDKRSIRVLRDEFYRAANIMRHDCNPSVTLFEPYIRDQF
ncbi:hypothetical protein O6H91_05G109900 [Diphasiastrum complanatum]|uniref:Uncharacterized protein n=1 Tax=Diphasiastrum complanatum TaxID=34168 RepID=A0ACC2DRZ5_DIPCM|nr:hypothetical protein O6H91_05G109900 [Diphasiastrum complanatum]